MQDPDIPRSGKCGNKVSRRSQHGQLTYDLVIPANPRTPPQVAVRDIRRALAARWRQLSENQRVRWNEDAAKHQSNPRLHQSGPLTGWNLFHKLNLPLAYYGRPQLDLPSPFPRFPRPAVSALGITNGPGGIKITLTCPHDPGEHTVLRASFPQSARKKAWTDFRFFAFCPAPVSGSADITALYTSRFGFPWIGSKIFLRVNQMIAGWEDAPRDFAAVVPPPA